MKEIKLSSVKVWYTWEQVPFGKFIKICEAQQEKNEIKILSLAVEIDEHTLRRAKIGPDFDVVMTRLRFLYKPPVWIEQPTKLGEVTMPKDITFESVEQFETMRNQYMNVTEVDKDDPVSEMRKFGMLAAIYYQPIHDKAEFDLDRVYELLPEIDKMSCVEVVSIGRFFWAKLLSLRSGIPLNSLIRNTPLKKQRQGLKPLLRRLISTLRSKFSRMEIFSSNAQS